MYDAFDDLVFHVAPDSTGTKVAQYNEVLVRWEGEIRYFLIGETDDPIADKTLKSLNEIAALANVPVVAAKSRSDANFRIFLDREKDYLINDNEIAGCYAQTRANKRGHLVRVSVHLPMLAKEAAEGCIDHELLHAFGFRGHTHRIRSTMSYVSGEDQWTRWDRVLVRALYHEDMPVAAQRPEALAIAKGLIPDLIESTQ